MNFRRMAIAMTIGLLISGSCTYFLSRRLNHTEPVKVAEQKYLAPSRALKAGETLKADNVELVNWPANTPIADAFTRADAAVGRSVLYPVSKGQPLTEQLLTVPGAGAGLAGKIPSGMRAIALRTDEVLGVGGFLQPDSHVDVLATVHTDKTPEPTTFIVLQDAQVLAAGHQIEPDPEGKPATVTVVTLLLSPPDAERAVLAALQGTIHFILRNGSDKDTPAAPSLDLAQLVGDAPRPSSVRVVHTSAKPVVTVSAPAVMAVETIAGDKQTTDTFRVGQQ
jgi:pilus assembly protein CpaB